MKHLIVAAALLVSGCAGMVDASTTWRGQDARMLVNKIGFPASEREIMGKTVYRWETGNPRGFYCNMNVSVDKDNLIEGMDWNGNNGGCAQLSSNLR